MNQKPDQGSTAAGVQVFELTMDNAEDQDDLNRRLHKPGELGESSLPKNEHAESTVDADRGRDQGS
ncbi:MAG: hypothetical protein HY289_09980 [Planctomycetes bacterium]|nr:hypothetical protein [Planctomycetota bacterium]